MGYGPGKLTATVGFYPMLQGRAMLKPTASLEQLSRDSDVNQLRKTVEDKLGGGQNLRTSASPCSMRWSAVKCSLLSRNRI